MAVLKSYDPARVTFERISEVLAVQRFLAQDPACLVPKPLGFSNGNEILTQDGLHWVCMEFVTGERLSRTPHLGVVESTLGTLRTCHERLKLFKEPSMQQSPGILERLSQLRHLVDFPPRLQSRDCAEIVRCICDNLDEAARRCLPVLSELASRQWQTHWILRDVWRNNVLTTQDKVVGIVDFDAVRVDTPVLDCVRFLGSIELSNPKDLDRLIAPFNINVNEFSVLDFTSTLLSLLQWLRWIDESPGLMKQPFVKTRTSELTKKLNARRLP